jgi:transposase-like protein
MMAPQRVYTDADRVKMRQLYSKHGNAAAVAREMGCSQNVVRCAVSKTYLSHRRSLNRQ